MTQPTGSPVKPSKHPRALEPSDGELGLECPAASGDKGTSRQAPASKKKSQRLIPAGVLELLSRRPGIAATAYDTAWMASMPDDSNPSRPYYPKALRWLVENQLPDGSWGGQVRYEHDRILCTLAALVPLATFGCEAADHASINAGTRYLWKRGHVLASEPTELVAYELLLPEMIRRAQRAGILVPPNLDIYARERAEKMSLIPAGALYSPRVTLVHSLEFLGDRADPAGLKAAQGTNGAIGNSPAATAFYFAQSRDPYALSYLDRCLTKYDHAQAPVLFPCETYELLWAAYHLFLAGVPVADLVNAEERKLLRDGLKNGGVSLSPTFPIPDADDTAVALLFLHELGESPDPSVLQAFALPEGNFASFQYERHSSVGVALHVLHALLRVPGYPKRDRTIDRLLDYIACRQISGLYWLDKWHISPYYATAHALCVLKDLPAEKAARMRPLVEKSLGWLRQTQNSDGSWGFYGEPTAEETAFGLLALVKGRAEHISDEDRRRCAAAARFLQEFFLVADSDDEMFPPLWIDKCLYTPTLVIRAVMASALIAFSSIDERGSA